ncbi:hypothetical protein GGR57DRAFT_507467 [Xylariaceae sp. FL1272]|nr:hypothetical protein GGR57DRAFT_507467 [Xylariaceae sp. FL1272]
MLPDLNNPKRPSLEPLWTRGRPTRAAHPRYSPSAHLSASPVSPGCLPSPLYPQFKDGMEVKERDHSSVRPLCHPPPSSLASPTSLVPKFEQFSILHPTSTAQADDPPSPELPELPELSSPGSSTSGSEVSDADNPHYHADNREHTTTKSSTLGRPAPTLPNLTQIQYGTSQPSPDAYIIARSLRRPSTSPDASPVSPSPMRITLRAVIRPRDPSKPVFLVQRTLDLDSLKSTSRQIVTSPSSPTRRRPLPVLPKRGTAKAGRTPRPVPATPISGLADKQYHNLVRDAKAVPVHLAALSTLPALAALLSSGHIHAGDVIYLAVPSADAFAATIRHVSQGKGGSEDCSPAVRANISYLGGHV